MYSDKNRSNSKTGYSQFRKHVTTKIDSNPLKLDSTRYIIKNLATPPNEQSAIVKTGIGIAASITDLFCSQPLNHYKTAAQNGMPFDVPKTPLHYFAKHNYHGFFAHATGFLPTMGLGYLAASGLEYYFPQLPKTLNGFIAGCVAGIPIHVADRFMIIKQTLPKKERRTTTYTQIGKKLLSEHGLSSITPGISATLVREGGFMSAIYMANEITQDLPTHYKYPVKLLVSVGCAVITNPADLVKTRVQAHGSPFKNSFQAAEHIYKTRGTKGFFDAVGWRIGRVGSGVFISSCMIEFLDWTLQQFKSLESVKHEENLIKPRFG